MNSTDELSTSSLPASLRENKNVSMIAKPSRKRLKCKQEANELLTNKVIILFIHFLFFFQP
jgi:hypothetical protein